MGGMLGRVNSAFYFVQREHLPKGFSCYEDLTYSVSSSNKQTFVF